MIEIPHLAGVRCKLDRYSRNKLSQEMKEIAIALFMPSGRDELNQSLELLICPHEIVNRMLRQTVFKPGIGDQSAWSLCGTTE